MRPVGAPERREERAAIGSVRSVLAKHLTQASFANESRSRNDFDNVATDSVTAPEHRHPRQAPPFPHGILEPSFPEPSVNGDSVTSSQQQKPAESEFATVPAFVLNDFSADDSEQHDSISLVPQHDAEQPATTHRIGHVTMQAIKSSERNLLNIGPGRETVCL